MALPMTPRGACGSGSRKTFTTGDGRFEWILRGRPGLKEKAFRYALVLGPNGIGKSQLVRELARQLSASHRQQSPIGTPATKRTRAPQQLARAWCQGINPFIRRILDDPWDAGEIVIGADWAKRLEKWLPAAPTRLILDDPYAVYANDVVALLDRGSGRFWYSVRLVIVDQFIPPGLGLQQIGANYRDQQGRAVPMVPLGEVHWSGHQFRAATARGLWIANPANDHPVLNLARDVKAFWDEDQMARVCEVFDGNPLMLAEAAHWLAKKPFRSIKQFLWRSEAEKMESDIFADGMREAYREQVAHRILGERVDELLNSHLEWERKEQLADHMFVEAIACAAIAGGIPLAAPQRVWFSVTSRAKTYPSASRRRNGDYSSPWLLAYL
jgi:hypothetical protein